MQTYGFIGLGDQGAPIAQRMIDAGLPTVLWARRSATLEPFRDTQATLLNDLDAFAQSVDYVGICVVDDAGVRDVVEKLLPRMKPGSVIVIHSTVSPQLCMELSDKAENYNLSLLDAPVSGGSPAAKEGKLTVMVGGDRKILDKVSHVFETFSHLIIHLGETGAGQHAKLINNSMLAANIGIAHQSLIAADKLSLDRESFVKLIQASSGSSFAFGVCARMVNVEDFRHGAELLAKDVDLLGQALNNDDCFEPINNAALSFLKDLPGS